MNPNRFLLVLLLASLCISAGSAQKITPAEPVSRITFMLKNTLGYHRMFRVEGPGIAYDFTMGRRETVPCHWPVGSRLYFSRDGETTSGLILTVTAADEGKTLGTDTGLKETDAPASAPTTVAPVAKRTVAVRLHNTSWLPRKVALISYEPGEIGNSTNIFVMNPKGTRSVRFSVGTKLYIADDKQVDVVMSGKRIDSDKPFLTMKAGDNGQVFDIK
ncbi:hypothetical protein [Spirosoma spitsbergense]|uniref:hypothetical protein n=1 Tax=Spirosoma spitsbergense TaxID=431554 RepID=UPI000374B1FE|nr:hypothetical protein [Spirosoma spitsbergense]